MQWGGPWQNPSKALRIARQERDEARQKNEVLERERDHAMMRRDMALKSAEAHFNERKQLEEELRKVNGAHVSHASDHLHAELRHAAHEKHRLQTMLKTVKQDRDEARRDNALLWCECDHAKMRMSILEYSRDLAEQERDTAKAQLKTVEQERDNANEQYCSLAVSRWPGMDGASPLAGPP